MAETDCEYVALSAGLELLLYNAYLDDRDDDDDDDVIRTLVVVHGRTVSLDVYAIVLPLLAAAQKSIFFSYHPCVH